MNAKVLTGILRILFGFIFLLAFLDKLFGLGFATASDKSWLAGISPTFGFLTNASAGPFKFLFNAIAGSAVVDWLFMLGLLLIGLALIFGMGLKIAYYSAALMLFLMWLAKLPPANNPVIDDHIIYIFTLLVMSKIDSTALSFSKFWRNTSLVKKYKFLE